MTRQQWGFVAQRTDAVAETAELKSGAVFATKATPLGRPTWIPLHIDGSTAPSALARA